MILGVDVIFYIFCYNLLKESVEYSKMYKYEYEKVSCNFGGMGMFNGNIYKIGDYKSIIDERAKNGWRYVGFIPTKQRGTGHTQEIELIFEKKENNE